VYQWPPLLVRGTVRIGRGVRAALVGRVIRPDGSTQLSYGGHPLYSYIRDVKPGLVTGQAIDQDGGPWYVLGPAGNEIRTPFTVNG
jgi:predicted lipoprotein with Yx(FWY)xxD motif